MSDVEFNSYSSYSFHLDQNFRDSLFRRSVKPFFKTKQTKVIAEKNKKKKKKKKKRKRRVTSERLKYLSPMTGS